MFNILFIAEADKNVQSVKEAFKRMTGTDDWGYDTFEDIEKAEKEGWLEFKNGKMIVWIEDMDLCDW